MKGRTKGNYDRILTQAHHNEMMARQKDLKNLEYYFQPSKKDKEAGARQVLALFRAAAEKGKKNGK